MISICTSVTSLRFWFALILSITSLAPVADANPPLQDQFGGFDASDQPVTLSSDFQLKAGSQLGVLNVRAKIQDNWHLYSNTQPPGGPLRSRIKVAESEQYKVIGKFKSDAEPHVIENMEGFDVPVEQHEHSVVWSAPIEIAAGVDPANLKIKLTFNGQTCFTESNGDLGVCKQLRNVEIESGFEGVNDALKVTAAPVEQRVEKFRPPMSHVDFSGRIVKSDGTQTPIHPGDKIVFKLTAESEGEFHVYANKPQKTDEFYSTLVVFTNDNGWKTIKPTASSEPEKDPVTGALFHHDPVTWSIEIIVPESVEEKNYTLAGLIGFQTCTPSGCDPPGGIHFSIVIPVGTMATPIPATFRKGSSYGKAEKAIAQKLASAADQVASTIEDKPHNLMGRKDTPEEIAAMASYYDPEEKINYLTLSELKNNPVGATSGVVRKNPTTLWTALFGAFVGGMLLNLMPCVFPVLGLKVMGFVKQAGSDAKKIRMHGIAFTAGLVVSMWVLAGIILTLKISFGQSINWGAQMGNPYFVVAIIVLLFMLGLNMAGVFEIGTSMTRVGGAVQKSDGYTSSFLSGILTTLIATPCSGPFLGAAMGYTLAQPAAMAMFLFTIFALGISFPYLVLSFFPALINKLPRPGAWMETFKVTMAFALFATVAFFMQAFGGQTGVDGLSWLAMALVVLGLAAFFYGTWSPPHVAPTKRRLFGFLVPGLIAAAGIWMSYDAASYRSDNVASHNMGGLDWQAWNPGKIEYMLATEPSIIWVDYTADW